MSKWSDVKIYDLSIPIGVNCPPWPTYEPVQMKFFKRLSSNALTARSSPTPTMLVPTWMALCISILPAVLLISSS